MNALLIIRQFVNERTGIDADRVIPAATFEELGVDSVTLLELLYEFEEKQGVTLPREVALPKTVGELLAFFDNPAVQP